MRYLLSIFCFVLFALFGNVVFAQIVPTISLPSNIPQGENLRVTWTFPQDLFPATGSHGGVVVLCSPQETTFVCCLLGAVRRRGGFYEPATADAKRALSASGQHEALIPASVPAGTSYKVMLYAVHVPEGGGTPQRQPFFSSQAVEVQGSAAAQPSGQVRDPVSPFDFNDDGCVGDEDLVILTQRTASCPPIPNVCSMEWLNVQNNVMGLTTDYLNAEKKFPCT